LKTLIALIAAVAVVAGLSGSALAQGAPGAMKEQAEKKPTAMSASGTVKSAAADSIVVAGKTRGKDTEWTFAVDPKTKIRKGGKDITAAGLAAGDNVHVRYHDDAGKKVADAVMVRAAKKPTAPAKTEMKPKTEEKK
jgi:hypothetical protein